MHNQERIMQLQNEERMLKCQYAARVRFNQAEVLRYLALIASIAPALTIFLSNSDNWLWLILPTAIDALILAFIKQTSIAVFDAAQLRNYFDSVVLNIIPNQYNQDEAASIHQKADKICLRHKKDYSIRIQNTGRDDPPGVKNWYEFSDRYTVSCAVYECQKQNRWWSEQLIKIRRVVSIALLAIVIAGIVLLRLVFKCSLIELSICFAGLVFNLFDFIKEDFEYSKLLAEMATIMNVPRIFSSDDALQHLQGIICRRRELPVLEINLFHKIYSKYWSELYETSNSDAKSAE